MMNVLICVIFASMISKGLAVTTSNNQNSTTRYEKEQLISALRKADFEEVRQLLRERALEEYLVGKDNEDRRKTLHKVYVKIRICEEMLSSGIAFVNGGTNEVNSTLPKDGWFEVFLVKGTMLKTDFAINLTAVKNWGDDSKKNGKRPLHIISSLPDVGPETVKVVLDNSKDGVDVRTDFNGTALIAAAMRGNLEVVKFLLEQGAQVNNFAYLTMGKNVENTYFSFIKVLSEKPFSFPETEFHYSALVAAACEDYKAVVEYLIAKGADVNNGGQSWAVLFHPVVYELTETLEILLKNGANVSATDFFGSTSLHRAAETGSLKSVKILLNYGADPNASDDFGWTPLHVASFFSNEGGMDMLKLLLESGSNIETRTSAGYSVLNLVQAGSNLGFLRYLVKRFDSLNTTTEHRGLQEVDSSEKHGQIVEFLINSGAPLNFQDTILGWSPLHWAAATGDIRVAKILVGYGAVVSSRSTLGLNPYETAKYFGRKVVAEFLRTAKDLVV